MNLHKTNGIVLRTLKYGETSVIVSIYTEVFGVQSYLINGVRTSSKKGPGKANLFQPAAILDLVVYYNELKNLHRIKEFKWSYLYQHLFFNVMKNSVALFMIELLQKCLKQPEPNADLYHFMEEALIHLDKSEEAAVGNYPLSQIRLNQHIRRILLQAYQTFYALHIQDFGTMKSLPVLQIVLSA